MSVGAIPARWTETHETGKCDKVDVISAVLRMVAEGNRIIVKVRKA